MAKNEKWIFIILSFALWISLAYFAGGPIYSDEMLYIDVGLRNLVEPHYGNRYFHIYLQKLFMAIAPTPLSGVRIFWGLLMALSAALVYYNARTFHSGSSILTGLLGVAIFFSFSIIKEYSGEPAVDITAMAVVAIYLTIYLDLLKRKGEGRYHLFFLGMLAFLGLKTKETTIFMNVLMVGLFLEKLKGKKWFKSLLEYFSPFFVGLASGILVFIILDGAFLGKPFFAISPSTFQGVFENYYYEPGFLFGPTSWYTEFLFDDILVAFVLFIVSGVLLREKMDFNQQMVWFYPLVYISFLSLNMLKVPWGFIERFIFPVMPVIAILAAQVVDFKSLRKKWYVGVGLLSTGLLFFVLREVWLNTAAAYQFDYARMLEAVYFPVLISLLIASIQFKNNNHWAVVVIQVFLVGTLLFTPLSINFKYFYRYPKVRERYAELFYPLESFKNTIQVQGDEKFYISTNLKNDLDMLSIDPNDISGMVNFYYDERMSAENVYVGYDRKKVASDLINRGFDYALLTSSDVASLMGGSAWDRILETYADVEVDEQEMVYLLKR